MKVLPRELAVEIYRKQYWTGPHINNVAAVYPRVAEEVFDTAVNMGPTVAVKFLQRALNALNRGAVDYPDIAADGPYGPITITALKGYASKRGAKGEDVLLEALNALQGERYISLSEDRPANEAFTYGWFANRVGAL